MSWIERGPLLQALRALAAGGVVLLWLRTAAAAGRLEGEAGLTLLGLAFLIYIGATILAGIVVQIVLTLLSILVDGEHIETLMDERDRAVERRSMNAGLTLAGAGLVAGSLALWQGWGAVWGLCLILSGFIAADIAVNTARFIAYRRGLSA